MVLCNQSVAAFTAFTLWKFNNKPLLDSFKTSALAYLHSIRKEISLGKWCLLDDASCLGSVSVPELIYVDGVSEACYHYRHGLVLHQVIYKSLLGVENLFDVSSQIATFFHLYNYVSVHLQRTDFIDNLFFITITNL